MCTTPANIVKKFINSMAARSWNVAKSHASTNIVEACLKDHGKG